MSLTAQSLAVTGHSPSDCECACFPNHYQRFIVSCDSGQCDNRAMGILPAGVLLTVMAAFLAGIASDNFVAGFAITAVVCSVALAAAHFLARAVISRRNR